MDQSEEVKELQDRVERLKHQNQILRRFLRWKSAFANANWDAYVDFVLENFGDEINIRFLDI